MLRADWRDDSRTWLLVDLTQWPDDLRIDPLPPVPVIGMGSPDHPCAGQLDLLLEPGFPLQTITSRIEQWPHASAAITHVLRCTNGLDPTSALTVESLAFAALQRAEEHARWRASQVAASPLAPGQLHVLRQEDRLDLVIDRPHALNAIDRPMRDALFDAFALFALDRTISTVSLRATGRAFSVGADLAEFGTTHDPMAAHAIRMRTLPAWPLWPRAAALDVHVGGACVGSGLELAAMAGRLTASPGAWFHLPEVEMGILPGFGGTVSIPRRIGRQRAALLMLSAKRINAATALEWGLIDAIVDDRPPDKG